MTNLFQRVPGLARPLLVLCAVFGASSLTVAEETRCARARHVVQLDERLPALHQKSEAGETIRIVAIGSSSTEGTPDLAKNAVYPAVAERELTRALHAPIEMINKGKGGETIPVMIARFEQDVVAQKPDLVIWQLGVNDVLRFDDMTPILRGMREGLDMLRKKNIPVVLMDLQTGPMVERDKDTPTMQAAIEAAGQEAGVMVFNRYNLMRTLEANGSTGSDLVQADGLHMTRFAHLCTGKLLAETIVQASVPRAQTAAIAASRR